MPSIYQLKPAFQACLRPIVRRLVHWGVTANQVTITAVVVSVAAGACILAWPDRRWPLLALPIVLLIRMALNAVDGMMAREHDMATLEGAVLNEMGDVVSDTALYLPLMRIAGFEPLLVAVVVALSVMTEMVGVVAIQIGASRRYDGPMGKSDRAFVIGAVGLTLGIGLPAGQWLLWVLVGLAVLLMATVVNRTRRALREVRS